MQLYESYLQREVGKDNTGTMYWGAGGQWLKETETSGWVAVCARKEKTEEMGKAICEL